MIKMGLEYMYININYLYNVLSKKKKWDLPSE